jgi:hypothetical protein
MATLYEYAKIAEAVYQPSPTSILDWTCPPGFAVDDGPASFQMRSWGPIVYPTFTNSPFTSGFQGRVFRHKGGEVVFAFKGTNPAMASDFWADWLIARTARLNQPPDLPLAQVSDALHATEDWSIAFPGVRQSIVGHSLGGWLAQMVGEATGIPFVTFQAPGAQGFPIPASHLRRSGPVQGVNVRVSRGLVTGTGRLIGLEDLIPGGPDSHSITDTADFLCTNARGRSRPFGW